MTDKEIIKALECCIKNDCDNCPLNRLTCLSDCLNMFLDVSQRQKAEIERLKNHIGDTNAMVKDFANQVKMAFLW